MFDKDVQNLILEIFAYKCTIFDHACKDYESDIPEED